MKSMLQTCKSCQYLVTFDNDESYIVMGVVKEEVENKTYGCGFNDVYGMYSPKDFEESEVPDGCPLAMEQIITGQIRR